MKSVPPHNHRVLIVDDIEDMRLALSDALTLRGYHCVAADHGESALRCLDSDRFHLVISDYRMPIMDGIQFLEALKKRPTPSPPVILLTGSKSEELRRRAFELGAYAVISKPIAPQDLAALSTRAIESREIDQRGSARGGVTD
jgi:CheY-like chemotaxis protein